MFCCLGIFHDDQEKREGCHVPKPQESKPWVTEAEPVTCSRVTSGKPFPVTSLGTPTSEAGEQDPEKDCCRTFQCRTEDVQMGSRDLSWVADARDICPSTPADSVPGIPSLATPLLHCSLPCQRGSGCQSRVQPSSCHLAPLMGAGFVQRLLNLAASSEY